MELEIVYNQN